MAKPKADAGGLLRLAAIAGRMARVKASLYNAAMGGPKTLAAKLGVIGAGLLLVALAAIGLTLWVTWQLQGGAAAVNEAGRLRMQTWRLAQALPSADAAHIRPLSLQFDQTIEVLRRGDPSRPLFVPDDSRTRAALAGVQRGWRELRAGWTATPPPPAAAVAQQAEEFVARVDAFVSAIETRLARLTGILNTLQFVLMALAVASAVAMLYSAYLFVFNPLARLQAGLARIGKGDLSARVEVSSGDEFGALSAGFNRMAETLQGLYQNLEDKVQEKTRRLQAERTRLAALYESAAFAAHASGLDALAAGFARQIRRVAHADAVAVRWSDESNQRYLLLASDGMAEEWANEEQCIATGGCLCGQPRGQAITRVMSLRAEETMVPLGYCQRGGFQTVISVPVQLQERMVGELNLFYLAATTLADEDRTLLETMASHLASAIEGLRVGALEREAAVAGERALLARELHDSIAQGLAFLKIQVGLLRGALKRQDQAMVERTLAELDSGVQESLADARELLVHFRTRTNAENIVPALQTTLQKFENQTSLTTHLSVEGSGLPLAADVQVQVLHVVQEALSNVRKHAQAQEVWVEVQEVPQWRVEVRDDGCGFVQETASADETHVGLRIMRERARSIGATVEVTSVLGSGTCVALTLPERRKMAA